MHAYIHIDADLQHMHTYAMLASARDSGLVQLSLDWHFGAVCAQKQRSALVVACSVCVV